MSPINILLTGSSSQRKGENFNENSHFNICSDSRTCLHRSSFCWRRDRGKKAEEQCEKDGGSWDAKTESCSGKYKSYSSRRPPRMGTVKQQPLMSLTPIPESFFGNRRSSYPLAEGHQPAIHGSSVRLAAHRSEWTG